MKQFDDWIQTAPVAPMRKFTCEEAMALAYEAGHEQGVKEGFRKGHDKGMEDSRASE